MKKKAGLITASIVAVLIIFSSCNRTDNQKSTSQKHGSLYLVKENFEKADKPGSKSYATNVFNFKSGPWLLDNALIGAGDKDAKNGNQSIRIRNKGRLSMQFDVHNASKITILYANYGTDKSCSWQLWESEDSGGTYNQVGETIISTSHNLQKFSALITVTGSVRFEIRKISGGNSRINIDDIIVTERGSLQNSGNDQSSNSALNTADTVKGDNSNLLLGNPSNAIANANVSADNYLIDHYYYVESYNKTKAEPNWVSWHISANDITGKRGPDDFRADTTLPTKWFKVDNTDYRGSGFDKGHNCPSGDRSSTSNANSSTFLMDNIIPQAPNNNQHTWEHLESFCRDRVREGAEVYVIMGNYGSGGTGRNGYATAISKGRINVPAHIWKVVVILPNGNNDLQRISTETMVMAVDTPNDNSIEPNWMKYICTVKDIEKNTGYNLLSALPQAVQDTLETKSFSGF